jgi:hypothetical protein
MSVVTAEDVIALATAAAASAHNKSTTPSKKPVGGKEKKGVKMHIGQKGCHDLPLVNQVSVFLNETLKVKELDSILETDKQMQQIQKHLKVRLEPEADFFRTLDTFLTEVPKFGSVNEKARKQMEPVVEAASRRPNTVPKQDLEDALLGLVHVVSMSLVTPNMGRRRTPSHNSTTSRTRARRGTGEQHPLPRGLRTSLSALQEDGQTPVDGDGMKLERTVSSDPSIKLEREASTDSTDSNNDNSPLKPEDLAPKIISGTNVIRPRNASAGSGTVFKLESLSSSSSLASSSISSSSSSITSSPPPRPHHHRKQGTSSLPVWTGSIEEELATTTPTTNETST